MQKLIVMMFQEIARRQGLILDYNPIKKELKIWNPSDKPKWFIDNLIRPHSTQCWFNVEAV